MVDIIIRSFMPAIFIGYILFKQPLPFALYREEELLAVIFVNSN